MGGQIIDASIVAVPKQRNSREENARIKAGETPAGWEDKPAKRRQDVEARWTKKHGKSHYGYKHTSWCGAPCEDAAEHAAKSSTISWMGTRLWVVGGQRLPKSRRR